MAVLYKPWGNIDWLTNKIAHISKWDFLGNISTEERSLGAWIWLKNNKKITNYKMWKIIDPDNSSSPYKKLTKTEYNKREKEYKENGGQELSEYRLLDSDIYASNDFRSFIEQTSGNVIIDISTMPKRWFFPIIKEGIANPGIKNLLVTYTMAKSYSEKQGEDPMAWKYFPSFGERTEREDLKKILIVSAGFQPLSLSQVIVDYGRPKVYILFPFPAAIGGYKRAWDFIRTVESDCGRIDNEDIIYVSGIDLPVIYDKISEIIKMEKDKEPVFLPYGPKPVSLAFALLASQRYFPVGYTQPMYYDPSYSKGFEKTKDGVPKTISYLLKESGKTLYKPPVISYK
jgi:hypothetical protein